MFGLSRTEAEAGTASLMLTLEGVANRSKWPGSSFPGDFEPAESRSAWPAWVAGGRHPVVVGTADLSDLGVPMAIVGA